MRRGNNKVVVGKVVEAAPTTAHTFTQAIRFTGDVETDAALLQQCLNLSVLRDALTGLPVHPHNTTGQDLKQPA